MTFEELFIKSEWNPIEYKGKTVFIADNLKLPFRKGQFFLKFIQFSSDWEQGLFLSTKGTFRVNNETLTNKVFFRQNTAPAEIDIIIESKTGVIKVWNAWNTGNDIFYYGNNGSAIYCEEMENGKKYFCNDGYPDDDFDDLIFTITW